VRNPVLYLEIAASLVYLAIACTPRQHPLIRVFAFLVFLVVLAQALIPESER
jgi:hypothetical protein